MRNEYFSPLEVNLTGEIRHHYNEKSSLPAHNLVLKPLLDNCYLAYVFGLKKEDELYKTNSDILISEKGKFRFDTSKECIEGHEYLWNATSWKRGSIIILLEEGKLDFTELFKNTYRPGLSGMPNSGNSLSATKKCREEAANGKIAICLPASNGIEWMTIYAKGQLFENLVTEAFENCKEKEHYK
ncbi:hypothetical protein [Flavobacterium sp. '19STA2R22 D10 B1']|uniref:hypothetical protein n=1 Tax=Flavobacterium aerium TaxID=3037261 RepID=UPI00278C2592|nr:hypothetical protein [Flavobacterium sp. '19STA2R22 D10 B1']